MVVCNLCKKTPPKTGPGSNLYRLEFAFGDKDKFSIHFINEDSSGSRYSQYTDIICGNCLKKLGVDKALEDDIRRNQERDQRFEKRYQEIQKRPRILAEPVED